MRTSKTRGLTRRDFLRLGGEVALSAVILAACQPKPAPTSTPAPASTAAQAEPTKAQPTKAQPTVAPTAAPTKAAEAGGKCQIDWQPQSPPVPKKYSPPIKISVIFGEPNLLPGDSITNNPMYNRIKGELGIEYQVHWQASGDAAVQKLQADIASGTLPDCFIPNSRVDLAKLIANDLVADIKDIWERTASPLLKEKKEYGKNTKMWDCVVRGDKLYGIAFQNGPAYNSDLLLWIRQDLLDKAGLKMPETLDELTNVMKTLKAQKLVKYGFRTPPWGIRYDMNPIFGCFGTEPYAWLKTKEGKLEYGAINPASKEALAVFRSWYADGLMNPEWFVRADSSVDHCVSPGAWWWYQNELKKLEVANPGTKWVLIPHMIKGPKGLTGRQDSGDFGQALLFKKGLDPAKIEAVINEFNWAIERHVNWVKYQQYGEYFNGSTFTEGYDWKFNEACDLVDGPAYALMWTYMWAIGSNYPNLCYPDYQLDIFKEVRKWYDQDPATLNKAQKFLISDPATKVSIEAYQFAVDTKDSIIWNEHYRAPGPIESKYAGDLDKLLTEYYTGIIAGTKPLDAFEEFVAAWKKRGGDETTAEVNAQYGL